MMRKSHFVALISSSKWQKTNLQLQINPRIMNEEFSPEVLIEYFCRTQFFDSDGCCQGNKKEGALAKSLLIFHRSPHLTLAGPGYWLVKWWVFIEQLNWMMFDTFRWGLMNGGIRGLCERGVKAWTCDTQGHLKCKTSIFFPRRQTDAFRV